MNTICIIPLILKVIFSSTRGITRFKKFVILILDILAITCQASIWFLCNKKAYNYKVNTDGLRKMQPDVNFPFYLIASTVLMSMGWWETYSEMRFSSSRFFKFIQNQIGDLRKNRSKIYVFISPLKIVLTFVFGYLLLPVKLKAQYEYFGDSLSTNATFIQNPVLGDTVLISDVKIDLFTIDNTIYLPLIVNIISSALCYFTSRLACKVLMQSLGFALPLSLTTPVTFTILALISLSAKSETLISKSFIKPLKNVLFLEGFIREYKKLNLVEKFHY
jgi:hypothetical protein